MPKFIRHGNAEKADRSSRNQNKVNEEIRKVGKENVPAVPCFLISSLNNPNTSPVIAHTNRTPT